MGKRLGALLLATGLALASAAAARAAGLIIIANPDVNLAAADIKEVFLGEKQFAGPVKLVPVDNAVAQEEFLRRAIAMDAAKYGTAWTKKGFREGLNPPSVKSSDIEVIEFVKRTPGAVGYITTAPAGGVIVIHRY